MNLIEWIDVREGLPDPVFDWVLVYGGGAMCTLGYNGQEGFTPVYPMQGSNVDIGIISHWAVLPDGPARNKWEE